jgi:hypothetical protein
MRANRRRRKIMRSFQIDEISSVVRPAQAGAVALLMKHDDPSSFHKRPQTELFMSPLRTSPQPHPASFRTFEEAVTYLKAHGAAGGTDAMSQARRQYPDLLAKYQAAPVAKADPAAEFAKASRRMAKQKFDTLVDDIAERRKVSRTAAMRLARQQNPEAYEDLQTT